VTSRPRAAECRAVLPTFRGTGNPPFDQGPRPCTRGRRAAAAGAPRRDESADASESAQRCGYNRRTRPRQGTGCRHDAAQLVVAIDCAHRRCRCRSRRQAHSLSPHPDPPPHARSAA
jgi:hypothetical protein